MQAIIEGETLQVLGCKSLGEDGLLVTVSRWALLWSWTLGTSYKSTNKSWESPNYRPLTTCVAHYVTCLFTDYWGATTTTSSYKHKSYFKNRILCNINLKLWPDELDWVKLSGWRYQGESLLTKWSALQFYFKLLMWLIAESSDQTCRHITPEKYADSIRCVRSCGRFLCDWPRWIPWIFRIFR